VYLLAPHRRRAVKVVSGLNDPLGVAWYRGRLYVASVGRVDAFGGFDGRRFTSRRRILDGPVAGGENNLLALAPDGRFVMGVTASCDHCTPKSPFSGSIVSFRPDGGDLRLFARRIRAPFGLAYFPGTNDLLVSFNQRDDLGARTPGDWLALVREGQDWRSPGCYGQGGAACVGVPRPIAVLDKHAAAGGVAIVTGQLGSSVGTSALVAEWASSKVLRVALTRTGSTYSAAVEPFLTA
jgi:glucose/arabinose dehydrogenase